MKSEDELLDLIAKTYSKDYIGYVKDYIAEGAIYISQWSETPVIGKEKVIETIQHWFHYHKNFNVWMEVIKHTATEKSMAHISLSEDGYKINSYIIIEAEAGLITRIYSVNRNHTRRQLFMQLKEKFFGSRAIKASEQHIK